MLLPGYSCLNDEDVYELRRYRVPMTASQLNLQGRPINGRIDSPLEPQPAPSLHQHSSSRVRIETRWRATSNATTKTLERR